MDELIIISDPDRFYRSNKKLMIRYLLGWGVPAQDVDDLYHTWIVKALRKNLIDLETPLIVHSLKMLCWRYHHNRKLREFINIDGLNMDKTDILTDRSQSPDIAVEISLFFAWLNRLNRLKVPGSMVAASVGRSLLAGASWDQIGRSRQCSWDRYRKIWRKLGTACL